MEFPFLFLIFAINAFARLILTSAGSSSSKKDVVNPAAHSAAVLGVSGKNLYLGLERLISEYVFVKTSLCVFQISETASADLFAIHLTLPDIHDSPVSRSFLTISPKRLSFIS